MNTQPTIQSPQSASLSAFTEAKRELKTRCMVFNAVEKEMVAKRLGLPRDALYGLSFVAWREVRRAWIDGTLA